MLVEPVALLPPPRHYADAYAFRAAAAADAAVARVDARSRPETAATQRSARDQQAEAGFIETGSVRRQQGQHVGARLGTASLSWDVLRTLYAFADQKGLHIDRHGAAAAAYDRVAAQGQRLQVVDLSV